jgi:uncharacterized protein
VLLKSGRRLNLLDPTPNEWEDEDLALGLGRTYRWGGHSAWELPLSVAQHCLTVLALRRTLQPTPLTPAEALRELLHDAEEGLLSCDPTTPIKTYLGAQFRSLVSRLSEAIAQRYRLPPWTASSYAAHKRADRLAAASEAFHVVGWEPPKSARILTSSLSRSISIRSLLPPEWFLGSPGHPRWPRQCFLPRLRTFWSRAEPIAARSVYGA